MIIVKIKGGLGNQLFELALVLRLQSLGKTVKIDVNEYLSENEKRILSTYANGFEIASKIEIDNVCDNKSDLWSRVKRRCKIYKKSHIIEDETRFMDEIFRLDNVYLEGYLQDERYFMQVKDSIKKKLDFHVEKEDDALAEEIESAESVSIHIRRGDYLEVSKIYGNICTERYYENAIKYVKDNIKNPVFYFFSDDIEWVKEKYNDPHYRYVSDGKRNTEAEFALMAKCKHNIIANSSFSWWAAWINGKNKVIVAPSKWNNINKNTPVCKDWIEIKEL